MTFKTWIASVGGISALSRLSGITRTTIHDWLRRKHTPNVLDLEKIVKLSGGKLTYQKLIDETRPLDAGRRGVKR